MKYIFGLLFAISAYFLSLGAGKDFHFSLYGLVAAIVCYAAYALLVYFSQKDKESAQENFSRRYDELINKLESVQESITNAELKFLENLKNIGGQICELDQKQKDCYDKTISHIENEAQEATIKLQSIIDKNAQTQSEGIKVVLSKIEDQ